MLISSGNTLKDTPRNTVSSGYSMAQSSWHIKLLSQNLVIHTSCLMHGQGRDWLSCWDRCKNFRYINDQRTPIQKSKHQFRYHTFQAHMALRGKCWGGKSYNLLVRSCNLNLDLAGFKAKTPNYWSTDSQGAVYPFLWSPDNTMPSNLSQKNFNYSLKLLPMFLSFLLSVTPLRFCRRTLLDLFLVHLFSRTAQ